MCLLIYKPAGHTISNESLESAWQANGDGAGVGYLAADGMPMMDKGYFKLKGLKRVLRQLDEVDTLIHFRLATHGLIDEDNCHPFVVNDTFLFAHNGILSDLMEEPIRSDTRIFSEDILAELLHNQQQVWAWQKTLLEMALGTSKGAVLSSKGIVLLNESAGVWDQGVWYSNKSYKPVSRYFQGIGYQGSGTTKRFSSYWDWDDENDFEYQQAMAREFTAELE